MFMVLLLVVMFVLAVIFGAVPFVQDELSLEELKRRSKKSRVYAERLRRQNQLPSLIVMTRMGAWLFLIMLITVSVAWLGWLDGFLISLVAVTLYPICTRLGLFTGLGVKLYSISEKYLLVAAEKTPYIWKFFYGRIPDLIGDKSGFASKEELIDSLGKSSEILTVDEKKLLINGLEFGSKMVKDVMTPKGVMQTVNKDEFIGPLVLNELYSSGHARLPVIDQDLDHVVGVLNLKSMLSLDIRKSSTASELMEPKVFYINEKDSLGRALNNFIKQKHHLFVVVNSHRETVGLITLEDVIESLIGKSIVDEDDVYEDMKLVADKKSAENNNTPNGTYL